MQEENPGDLVASPGQQGDRDRGSLDSGGDCVPRELLEFAAALPGSLRRRRHHTPVGVRSAQWGGLGEPQPISAEPAPRPMGCAPGDATPETR